MGVDALVVLVLTPRAGDDALVMRIGPGPLGPLRIPAARSIDQWQPDITSAGILHRELESLANTIQTRQYFGLTCGPAPKEQVGRWATLTLEGSE